MSTAWPVLLRDREIELRPLRRRDRRELDRLRRDNDAWTGPWEARDPDPEVRPPATGRMIRWLDDAARSGTMVPLALVVEGRLAGQVAAGPVRFGAHADAPLGYWIDERLAGRGIVPRAVALLMDHCFSVVGLHRLEAAVRPDNAASIRVAEKLGLRDEGIRRSCIFVDGAWRDHRVFALTAEEAHDEHGRGIHARLLAENQVHPRGA